MSQHPCPTCPTLRAEVLAQRGQIARLQLEVAVLQRIIAEARGACIKQSNEAQQTMAGHVPRGTWVHAKGRKEAAQAIIKHLA